MMDLTERKLKALGFEPIDRNMIMFAIEKKMRADLHSITDFSCSK
jgi:hypothetical protein